MSYFAKRFWPPRFFSKAYWGTGEATPGEVTLSGQQAMATSGALVPGITILLTGQEVAAASGVLGASTGDGVEVALTGQQVVASGGSFFGVRYLADDDLFTLYAITADLFSVSVVQPLMVVVEDTELVSTNRVDELWAQQQVDELFASATLAVDVEEMITFASVSADLFAVH